MTTDLEPLIARYLDGTITRGEMDLLNAALHGGVEARREFAEWLNLDSAIAALTAGEEPAAVEPRKIIRFPAAARWLAAAACFALLLAGGRWWHVAHESFATVAKSAGAAELAGGDAVHGERHQLRAGTVELVTARGARVVIEAPAEFRFESARRLHVVRGRVAAEVPPSARGFTVVTPSGDAVDLGTRFGVDVPENGPSEVHVFQGQVIAKAAGASAEQSLRGGEALSMARGVNATRDLRSSAFIQPTEVRELSAGLAAGQQARSEAALAAWRKDPALIALLDFEDAVSTPACRVVQGRWPGSRAPEFVNVGDHFKLDVGGERAWPQLTLAAWVRIDRLGAPYQSLLHTDGWSRNNAGQVHWMINRNMTMRLALYGNTLAPGSVERDRYPDSRTSVLPEQGRWVHLVAVYDADQRTVRFYLNGNFDSETRQEVAAPARLGPAQIGNWDQSDRKLSGRIDELLILGRAMSDGEVRALFDAGNPYR